MYPSCVDTSEPIKPDNWSNIYFFISAFGRRIPYVQHHDFNVNAAAHDEDWLQIEMEVEETTQRFPTNHDCLLEFLFSASHHSEMDNDFIYRYRALLSSWYQSRRSSISLSLQIVQVRWNYDDITGQLLHVGCEIIAFRTKCVCDSQLQAHCTSVKLLVNLEAIKTIIFRRVWVCFFEINKSQ